MKRRCRACVFVRCSVCALLYVPARSQRHALFFEHVKNIREHVAKMLADDIIGGLGAQRFKFRDQLEHRSRTAADVFINTERRIEGEVL